MYTKSVVSNPKNTVIVNSHPQTGVQIKHEFCICQHIHTVNKKAILSFTQWNKRSKIKIKYFDTVRWLPGALFYEFYIIRDIFEKHDLWCNMSLNLPNSKGEIYWVKSFLTLDRFKWPDTQKCRLDSLST